MIPSVPITNSPGSCHGSSTLARPVPWPSRRHPEARVQLAAQELVGCVEEDLRGRSLEKPEGLVYGPVGIAHDRNLQALEFAVAGRPRRFTLSDDCHVAPAAR